MHLLLLEEVTHKVSFPQVMKTYHMYHAESISAESKLKEAEKQEEKQFNKSGDISVNLLRHEDRPQRRSSVKKIEKMKEKVGEREPGMCSPTRGSLCSGGIWLRPISLHITTLQLQQILPDVGISKTV